MIPFKKYFLELLFPIACLGCGAEGSYLCADCIQGLAQTPPSCMVCKKLSFRTCRSCRENSYIYGFFSPYRYDAPLIRELIHGLKYRRIRALGGVLARFLAAHFDLYGIRFPENACLISVPLHSRRRRRRGFNQAGEIAVNLGALLGIEVRSDVLYKTRNTAPQVGLLRGRRQENVSGAFAVFNPAAIEGRTIILLDDVKTTGATLEEAARMLREAGAARVWAVTVAR